MVKQKIELLAEEEIEEVQTLLKDGFQAKGIAFHYNHSCMRLLGSSSDIMSHEDLVSGSQGTLTVLLFFFTCAVHLIFLIFEAQTPRHSPIPSFCTNPAGTYCNKSIGGQISCVPSPKVLQTPETR